MQMQLSAAMLLFTHFSKLTSRDCFQQRERDN